MPSQPGGLQSCRWPYRSLLWPEELDGRQRCSAPRCRRSGLASPSRPSGSPLRSNGWGWRSKSPHPPPWPCLFATRANLVRTIRACWMFTRLWWASSANANLGKWGAVHANLYTSQLFTVVVFVCMLNFHTSNEWTPTHRPMVIKSRT